MSVFSHSEFNDHERVVFIHNKAAGLEAIVAIHRTTLGPSLGGCRMLAYQSDDDALTDALRLSKAMSYKCAMAGLPHGGGKAVVVGDPKTDKGPALLEALAEGVEGLGGEYIIGQDSGMNVSDIAYMADRTQYIAGGGTLVGSDGKSQRVDPSPLTGLGILGGIRAAAEARFNSTNLSGLRVAIQGLGNVGMSLAKLLHQEGADLVVHDIQQERVAEAVKCLGATAVKAEEIYCEKVDIFAPCALGGILNDQTIPTLNCAIVAGGANNQLLEPQHGERLADRNILFVPDYVLNAGGVILLYHSRLDSNLEQITQDCVRIEDTVREILQVAKETHKRPETVADRLARQRFETSCTGEYA